MATAAFGDAPGVTTPESIGATPPDAHPRLKTRSIDRILYGVGSIAFGVKDNGFTVLLMIFYNQALGLSAASVGFAIMVALVVDAICDPFIGRMTDNFRSRFGRRHPFMYAAALPVAVSYYFLWNPPAGLTQSQLFWYLLVAAVIIRICISVYEIPSSALIVDLVKDYDSRTGWLSWRWFFGYVGGMGMNIAAFSLFLRPGPNDPSGQLNLAGYSMYGTVSSLVMFAAILISAFGTQRHVRGFAALPEKRPFIFSRSAREIWGTLINKPFLLLAGATLFSYAAGGVGAAMLTYFRLYLWELSGDQISGLMIGYIGALFTALWFGPWLARRLGKKRAAITCWCALIVFSPLMYFGRALGVVPDNGSQLLYALLFTTGFINTTIAVSNGTIGSSLFADVVEYSAVRTGAHSAGLIFSANAFMLKAISGFGVFGAGIILSVVNFPQGAKQGEVPQSVLTNLALLEPAIVLALQLGALLMILGFPITRAMHAANVRKLADQGDEPAKAT